MGVFQKRAKMFNQHTDGHQFYTDIVGREDQLKAVQELDIEAINEAFGTSFWPKTKPERPYRLLKAQFNDPVCVYALLDLLVRSRKGIYIRGEYLEDMLTREYPQYVWQGSTIGRMMAGLKAVCAQEYYTIPEEELPFAKGRDARGKYYVIDPRGGDEGWLFLLKCRKIAAIRVQEMMQAQRQGDVECWNSGFTQPSVLYGEWFDGTRIRDDETYRAQQRVQKAPVIRGDHDVHFEPFGS